MKYTRTIKNELKITKRLLYFWGTKLGRGSKNENLGPWTKPNQILNSFG